MDSQNKLGHEAFVKKTFNYVTNSSWWKRPQTARPIHVLCQLQFEAGAILGIWDLFIMLIDFCVWLLYFNFNGASKIALNQSLNQFQFVSNKLFSNCKQLQFTIQKQNFKTYWLRRIDACKIAGTSVAWKLFGVQQKKNQSLNKLINFNQKLNQFHFDPDCITQNAQLCKPY